MSTWGNGPVSVRLTVGQTTIAQSDIISFTHRAACCDGDIGLGQVCAASITATLTGARELLGVSIKAELGETSGGTLVWHDLGMFVVSECQTEEDSTSITAQDAAWWALAGGYVPTVSSGATVYDVLEDVADQCALDVEQTTLNLGLSITVTGTLTGHTCRAMLGYLAALCGCNCVISRAGEIRFVWFADSGETIDPDRTYAGAHTFGGTSTLLGLKCTVPDGDSESTLTAGNADKAVEVVCPYMTQTRLSALWSALGGYQWPVLEVSCYGGAEVLPGDLVTVEDIAGNSLSVPVMEVSLSVDGGCRCTLRSYGKGDTARGADSIGPRELRLQRVEQTAGVAMQSANGKNKCFYQASAPAASVGLTAGDIWFDTANGNRLSTWTGSAWSAFTLQNAAISNLDVGAITSGRLTAEYINVEDVFSRNISATGSINGARLTTGTKFSVDQYGILSSAQGSFSECEMSNGYIGTCSCEDLLFAGGWIAGPGGGIVEDIYDFRAYRYGTDDNGGLVIEAGFPEVVQPMEEEEVEPQAYSTPEDMWSNVGSSPVQIARFFLDSSGVGHAYFGQVHASGSIFGYGSNYHYLKLVDLGTFSTDTDFQSYYTSSGLKSDISSGVFQKAIVGGFVTIAGYKFILAHPDYWLNTGDTACTTHHMLVVPAGTLENGRMNTSNTTAGAYNGSYMKTTDIEIAYSIIVYCFGAANLLTHREYFQNAVSNGYESGGGWYDSTVDLMNERMVYGADVFHNTVHGSNFPNCYTIDKTQIALFRVRPDLITIRQYWWLRDVASSVAFCYVDGNGQAGQAVASDYVGIRPVFAIC